MKPKAKHWVDPEALPDSGLDVSHIAGNAPNEAKRLVWNVFTTYGIVSDETFGASVGKAVRFVEANINRRGGYTTCDVLHPAMVFHLTTCIDMLNGAGMMHGGCIAYLIDNCASTPLVVLGIVKDMNGVGVTQNMQVTYHSPAPLGTILQIVSTSVTLGSRVMTARCEIFDKDNGRVVASAFLSKMQPQQKL
ncbi:HotDog domain-containing protein [Vararia minispora EC-137]|uniref:HotDog domain-containing protein n=1 Tax=Vararia minispora EC-137 TaxID=1314806 RepID=A0ACB8QZB5_9AGAM|nr:HotDog domain-containing protein [Vararia minispora EC-137]